MISILSRYPHDLARSPQEAEVAKLIGARCDNCDLDEIPELDEAERCFNCRLWEAVDVLIHQSQVEARIDEVQRMPNPAYIGNDGIRREPNNQYQVDRIRELEALKQRRGKKL